MASPIDRDQFTLHYSPPEGERVAAPEELRAPNVEMAPVQQAPASSGRLKKAFYDEETHKTFTLTVTEGNSRRYLALPESAWRDMLPDLRAMHVHGDFLKSITDLSTRQVVGIDREDGNPLCTYQIPEENHPRMEALTNVRSYLVQNNYAKASLGALTDGYDTRAKARKTFTRERSSELNQQYIDRINARKGEFDNWTTGARGDNPETRLGALPAILDAKRTELMGLKGDLEDDLRTASRRDLRQIENINREIAQVNERLAALAHATEISLASALLNKPYDHKAASDWRVPLRMAFDAKMILINHFTQRAEQPLSNAEKQILEDRATDIAALLIPTAIGDGDEEQSGEAILRLFYAGGDTLSALVRPTPPAAEGNMPQDPPMRVDIPKFKPVIPPKDAGHSFLRQMLTEFHTAQNQPQALPPGHDVFND